jgi:hypothetical protein
MRGNIMGDSFHLTLFGAYVFQAYNQDFAFATDTDRQEISQNLSY